MITHWSDSIIVAVIVCGRSRVGRREYAEVRVCGEGKGVGRFDWVVVCWMRTPQQPRVYVLEGEITYVEQARGSAESEN